MQCLRHSNNKRMWSKQIKNYIVSTISSLRFVMNLLLMMTLIQEEFQIGSEFYSSVTKIGTLNKINIAELLIK